MLSKEKKDVLTLVIGKFLQVIIALISIKVLTEVLSTEEVGNYYLLLSILIFFNFTFLNPLGQYYGRHLISWQKSKNLFNATIVLIGLRILAIVVAMFFAYGVFEYFEYNKYCTLSEFLLFLFISLISGTYLVLLSAVNTLGNRIKFIRYMVATLAIGLLLSLYMVSFIDQSAIAWFYGIAISQLLFSVSIFKDLVKNNHFSMEKIKSKFSREYVKKIFYFIIPITITLFLQWGQNISYRFIVEAKYSIEVLAYIGVGLAVSGAIFSAVESLLTQYYNPIYLREITEASKEERTQSWNKLANYMIPIYILLAMYIIALSPYLTNLLVAQKFQEAYLYTMFGAMIEFFRVITNIIYMVSQSELKTNTTIIAYTIGFTISISALYLFDMSEALWIIPLSLSLSSAIVAVILFINMRKLLKISINIISILKSFIMALPFLTVFFIENDRTLLLTLLLIVSTGIYFLFAMYVILEKQILGKNI